jgi:sugar lactone lactonase YvrE
MKKKASISRIIVIMLALSIFSCSKSSNPGTAGTGGTGGTGSTGTGTGTTSNTAVSTYAGSTAGKGTLYNPSDIAFDSQGNMYVTEYQHSDVQKIDATGNITLFTGNVSNPGCEDVGSTLTFPQGIWFAHDSLYVADNICGHVKTFSLTGAAKTYAFNNPNNYSAEPIGVCVDNAGNVFMESEAGDAGILEVTTTGQVIKFGDGTNAVKDGSAATSEFGFMSSICADNSGNVYISDSHRIRRISNGTVTTIAGNTNLGNADGQGAAASFAGTMGLCCDSKGNVWIADSYNNTIRMMTPGGQVTTIAGDGNTGYKDGTKSAAEFSIPTGLCFDKNGILYVADFGNSVVRKIVL